MADPPPNVLRAKVAELLVGRDLDAVNQGEFRCEVEAALGIDPGGMVGRQAEFRSVLVEEVSRIVKMLAATKYAEDLGEEAPSSQKREVYLVTFPRPTTMQTTSGQFLRAPGDFSREAIGKALLDALAASQTGAANPLSAKLMAVFQAHKIKH